MKKPCLKNVPDWSPSNDDFVAMPKLLEKVSEFHTLWRVIDSHWVCVTDSEIHECLSDYLWNHGFDIPSTITYCLAENARYKLKFRQSGGLISVFITSK